LRCCAVIDAGLQAPGEAEAELAYLNRLEIIDAVLSDDVDNFLFGATLVMRKYEPLHSQLDWSIKIYSRHMSTVPVLHSPEIKVM
jgi:XPG I-region